MMLDMLDASSESELDMIFTRACLATIARCRCDYSYTYDYTTTHYSLTYQSENYNAAAAL